MTPPARPRPAVRRLALALALPLAAGCGPGAATARGAGADGAPPPPAPDSLVVERGPCFGSCPAYRARLSRAGAVRLEPRPPGRGPAVDTTPVTARVAPATLDALVAAAESAGVLDLPPRIADDPALCASRASDHATVTIALFGPAGRHAVEDDLGCRAADGATDAARRLARLRAWQARVDSVVVGAARRPSPT